MEEEVRGTLLIGLNKPSSSASLDNVAGIFTDLHFLEAEVNPGEPSMIFDLAKGFVDVLPAMPNEHPRRRILALLDEAVRRDVHFIDRHPNHILSMHVEHLLVARLPGGGEAL